MEREREREAKKRNKSKAESNLTNDRSSGDRHILCTRKIKTAIKVHKSNKADAFERASVGSGHPISKRARERDREGER